MQRVEVSKLLLVFLLPESKATTSQSEFLDGSIDRYESRYLAKKFLKALAQ